MQTFIILFKGVNVGGHNLLPMKDLVTQLKQYPYDSVTSYIQSGNIVLKSADNPTDPIQQLVAKKYGFTPDLFVFNESTFSQADTDNPYTEYEGKYVHVYFCHKNIALVQKNIDKFIDKSEQYTVKGKVFYLHAPNGIGRSKLIANIEACLGQKTTGRNLNTMNKISLMMSNA